MPEVTYRTTMALTRAQIWDFVADMNNWAPMLTGYQSHEVKTDRHSVWTLKGDVGILARTVELDVNITEWVDQERVTFTLEGLNELVGGGGEFVMTDLEAAAAGPAPEPEPEPTPGLFQRFLRWVFGALFRRKFGTVERTAALPTPDATTGASLSFTLRMDAGGPTAPLVNAMLEPALLPAAEDLGNKIAAHLEATHGVAAAA